MPLECLIDLDPCLFEKRGERFGGHEIRRFSAENEQAFRTVIPPMGGLFISLTKNTSLVIVMGVQEVASKTEQLINESVVNTLVIVLGTVTCYMVINLPASYLISRIERRAVFVR